MKEHIEQVLRVLVWLKHDAEENGEPTQAKQRQQAFSDILGLIVEMALDIEDYEKEKDIDSVDKIDAILDDLKPASSSKVMR